MSDIMEFPTREAFRAWLSDNGQTSGGVWLLFGKPGGPKTLKAAEALEEALCFGWIDGQMRRIDDLSYKKYFSRRRENSRWSAKNRALAGDLEARGLMTASGREAVEAAKANGQWYAPDPMEAGAEEVSRLTFLLEGREPAFTNFQAMPLSVKKTYTRAYLDAKTEAGRQKRIAWMVDRLNQNLRPM